MAKSYEDAIQAVVEAATADYSRWCEQSSITDTYAENYELKVKHGRVYTKIIQMRDGRSSNVWGFVVKSDTHKFPKGSLLKAASFKTPALNHPRGNIFGAYKVTWCGPLYCGAEVTAMNEVNEVFEGIKEV